MKDELEIFCLSCGEDIQEDAVLFLNCACTKSEPGDLVTPNWIGNSDCLDIVALHLYGRTFFCVDKHAKTLIKFHSKTGEPVLGFNLQNN